MLECSVDTVQVCKDTQRSTDLPCKEPNVHVKKTQCRIASGGVQVSMTFSSSSPAYSPQGAAGPQYRSEASHADYHPDCDPSNVFEERLASICGSIEAVEMKCEASDERRRDAEKQLLVVTQRLCETDAVLQSALPKLSACQAENLQLKSQVNELQQQLSSCQYTCDDLAAGAEIDRARLTSCLSEVQFERDSALNDLANAYSDMQAMQAALLDSALYVRFLRTKLLESQAEDNGTTEDPVDSKEPEQNGVMFSFEKTKHAIRTAIQEAATLEPAERAKRIKALRLRWHPDKNPDFALEFANEVTKIINETVAELQI